MKGKNRKSRNKRRITGVALQFEDWEKKGWTENVPRAALTSR